MGAGPVGLVLALMLDRYDVNCTIFNLEESSRWHPKGNTHNARTMEHYRTLGLSACIRQLGLPFDHPTDVAYFTRYSAWELARLRMPSEAEKLRAVAAAPRTDQVPEPIHRGNQMYIEKFLLDYAGTRPRITMRLGWEVTRLSADEHGVTVIAERTGNGQQETWRAGHVVGCDGGRSFVRRHLGIGYEGHGTIEQEILGRRATATHLRLPTLYRDFMADRRAWNYWAINRDAAIALVALNGVDEFFLVTSSIDPDDPDEEVLTRLVHQAAGTRHTSRDPRPPRMDSRRGARRRVIRPGARLHRGRRRPPVHPDRRVRHEHRSRQRGESVMEACRDHARLGGSRLLDSYEAERKPIAHRNTSAARELNRNLGAIARPPELDEDSEAGAAARRAVGEVLMTFGEEFASLGVQLGARYDASEIIARCDDPPADHLTVYTPSSVPGGRAPHVWLDDWHGPGSSLFDQFSRAGFTLLRLGDDELEVDSLRSAFAVCGVPLKVLAVRGDAARELYGCELALIRPDQHVAWRGRAPPETPEALAALVSGRAPSNDRLAQRQPQVSRGCSVA